MSCNRRRLCRKVDCEICFQRSFASHPNAQYWSPKNAVTPRQVFQRASNPKFLFDCTCGHEFEITTGSITDPVYPSWCPYCSNPPQKLCKKDDCQSCFGKSFASHWRSGNWSSKNDLEPRAIFKGTTKKYTFDCECGHEFEISIANVAIQDKWCSYCCNPPLKLCDSDSCEDCLETSFASHPRAANWSDRNKLTARQTFKNANSKAIFLCDYGHEFEVMVYSVTSKTAPTWCPHCKYKTEAIVYEFLLQNYPTIKIRREASFSWCVWAETGTKCRFDFYLGELNLIIEIDGPQHFKQISNWSPPEETLARDIFKMNSAVENGITVARLLQEDILRDKLDWQTELRKIISLHKQATRIFIARGDEYAAHGDVKYKK